MTVGYYTIDHSEMVHGMYNKQFTLSLQPIINIENELVETFEVFIRWKHPLLGMMPPSFFMPRVLDAGLASKMTDYIISQSVNLCNKSIHIGNQTGVNININLHEIRRNQTLQSLSKALEEVDNPEKICLEITPHIWLNFFEENKNLNIYPDDPPSEEEIKYLETLKSIFEIYSDMGITLALDTCDFVLGAIDRAEILGIHAIKISRKCLSNNDYLVNANKKAKNANIALVATAVENTQQMKAVIMSGIKYVQGIIMCPPVYEQDVDMWNKDKLSHIKTIVYNMDKYRNDINNAKQNLQSESKNILKEYGNTELSPERTKKLQDKNNIEKESHHARRRRMEHEQNRIRSLSDNSKSSYLRKND